MLAGIPPIATLDEIIDWLTEHRRAYPEHGAWNVEVRDRLIVKPPGHVTHDDQDRVVILTGMPYR